MSTTTKERPEKTGSDNQEVNAAADLTRSLEQLDSVSFLPFGATKELNLTLEDVRHVIATPTKSGKLPSDRDIRLFLKLCEFRGLNPYVKDAFLVGYDSKEGPQFSTIVAHQAMVKRADAHDKYVGKKSGVIVWDKEKNEKVKIEGDVVPSTMTVIGGWCTVYRSDRPEHPETAETAMKAYNKGFGHWNIDPNWMICKCAEAKGLRAGFPHDLEGMEIREEVEARIDTVGRMKPSPTVQIGGGPSQDNSDLLEGVDPDPLAPPVRSNEPTAEEKAELLAAEAEDGVTFE